MLSIGVPKERTSGEARVALIPETAGKLSKAGLKVIVEAGAGQAASFLDDAYEKAGVTVAKDASSLYAEAGLVLKVQPPSLEEADQMREGGALVSFLNPVRFPEVIERLAKRKISAFSMELIPRITRAQRMDALSSMSTVAGYKAALMAADHLGKFFPLLMTAAGTIAPARVFVLGAGVAGLQAIATSRRLGAVVEAFDVRPAVREEVQSLGATFIGPDMADPSLVGEGGYAKEATEEQHRKERELLAKHVKGSDAVITTAMVPNKRAPVLVTEDMVREMRKGSVIVDLAAEGGGNCELTEPGKTVVKHEVIIMGPLNLASSLPVHASQMYARNISALVLNMIHEGSLKIDFEDEIIAGTCVTHEGRILKGPAAEPAPPKPAASGEPPRAAEKVSS